ncbi:MAG: putative EamA-like transporter family protein [Chlamydiia bacterium]|nr:putative EamA-like transporter family protein [Chlamydiia bacterium]
MNKPSLHSKKYILYALLACSVWGLIFILPKLAESSAFMGSSLAKYVFGGLFALLFAIKLWRSSTCPQLFPYIKKAFWFALISNITYYSFLMLSFRYATPTVSALIIGISPISIAYYGNWRARESSQHLILPSILIFVGLVLVNIPYFDATDNTTSRYDYLAGLLSAFGALISWSWYVVSNTRFLKAHPTISSGDWATFIGLATSCWILFLGAIVWLFSTLFPGSQESSMTPEMQTFLLGSITFGLFCSWVGLFLWNKASKHLPVSLVGQLTIFETIFGLFFVSLVEKRVPSSIEVIGIALMLAAIVYGVRGLSTADQHQTATYST